MTGTPLRACGGCGGSFLGDNRNEIWFCPKCTAKLPPFNPRPYRVIQADGGDATDQTCRRYGDAREWVVCDRQGDAVTVKPLGFPDGYRETVNIAQLRPAYYTPGR